MADFVPEAPEVGELPIPDDSNPTNPPDAGDNTPLSWDKCETLLMLYNNGYIYYESSERNANGTFRYTLEIKNKNQEVYFTGKDANGNDISRTYGLSSGVNKNYRSSEGALFRFGSVNKLEDKYIEFKPHNMENYIKFSWKQKQAS